MSELEYQFHDRIVTVTQYGSDLLRRQKIKLGKVFAGQNVRVKQVSEQLWLVSFMDYELGFFDDETYRLRKCS